MGSLRVLPEPAPSAAAISVGDRSVVYELTAYAPTAAERTEVKSELLQMACQHMAAVGVLTSAPGDASRRDVTALSLLAQLDLFSTLNMAELEALAAKLTWVHFSPGETVYEADGIEGGGDNALLVVARGVGALHLLSKGGREVRRLGPGEAVGRASILTGVSVNVRLRAVTPVDAIRLAKDDLTDVLASRPEVGRIMLESLLEYQARANGQDDGLALSSGSGEGLIRRLLEGVFRFHGLSQPKR
jgi:CRP-like cAMP-binding protein